MAWYLNHGRPIKIGIDLFIYCSINSVAYTCITSKKINYLSLETMNLKIQHIYITF